MTPFIPKDDAEMPDFYSITVKFLDKTETTYQVVGHKMLENPKMLECLLHGDTFTWLPVEGSVKEISFDKNFTKVMMLKAKTKGASNVD